ncbi:MAG: hypothetical protein IKL89_05515 [Clostridia bacterium]|nr:hypothetical protein [Clostridia bacterium]
MKKTTCILLVIMLSILCTGCFFTKTQDERFHAVLKGEQECITADGKAHKLSDLVPHSAKAASYALLDMDGDTTEEMLVSFEVNGYAEYIVLLHEEEKTVRAWLLGKRQMYDIRADGSFCATDNASETWYYKILLHEGLLYKSEIAYCSHHEELYRVNGAPASRAVFDEYITEREQIAAIDFIPLVN